MVSRLPQFAWLPLLALAAACQQQQERPDAQPDRAAAAAIQASFESPWDTVTRNPDASRLPGDTARPTYFSLGGVHLGRDLGPQRPINGDPRFAAHKMVPCSGNGQQCTVHFRVDWGNGSGGPGFDSETLFVTVRRPGGAEERRAVLQNETDLAITIPGCGQVEVEAALSAGVRPGLQSEVTVWAVRSTCS